MNGESRDDTITYRWILCWRNLYDGGSVIGVTKLVGSAPVEYKDLEKREKQWQVNHTRDYIPWILQLELSWVRPDMTMTKQRDH